MRKAAPAKPHKRDGVWYLVRRVPAEFAHLDRRGIVRVSTGIAVVDDPRGGRAADAVKTLAAELDIYWRGMRDGQSAEARIRFEAAQKRARVLGLPYQTAQELSEGSLNVILQRLDMLVARGMVDKEQEVAAVFGGEARPTLRLSTLLDEFEALQSASLSPMSPDQLRRWRNPKKRAVDDLIAVVGDKKLDELTRVDAVAFRRHWQDRIVKETLDIATGNKAFGHVAKMLRTVDDAHQLALKPVFARLRIEGAVQKQRAPFDAKFVQDRILADGMLADLNDEARRIVYVVADTGLRPSEAANLLPEHIKLDAPVPHVLVWPVGRVLKTEHSRRSVPLVGVALAAMKLQPSGFPRYRDKGASLSALVNKVLGSPTRNLLPSDNHSLYSLRHTFEDRLTSVEAPEKVVASLMGHKWHRPKYGAGPSLEQKRDWMLKIAFTPPKHV